MKKFPVWAVLTGLMLSIGPIAGCSRKPAASGPVIATVNGDPISAAELKRELALRLKQDPSFKVTPGTLHDELELIINRKLLVQEAIRRKISEEENFVAAMRLYWEQSLVSILMNRLSEQFTKAAMPATDAEVEDYYSKLSSKATFDLVQSQDRTSLERLLAGLQTGKPVVWQRATDALSYDELRSTALRQAFSLEPGQARIFSEGAAYYLVRLRSKTPASPPPLASIADRIRENIGKQKAQDAFDDWLAQQRAKADIKVEAGSAGEGA